MSLLACGVAFGALAGAGAVQAQTAPAAGSEVKEVIVTANKRNERIQDVASSVSSVSGADLTQTQTLDLQDLVYRVPGLNILQDGYFTKILLRGLNSSGDGATVATVFDDVPLSFSGAATDGGYLATDQDTDDLKDVEVLRGPQGTLYGATAEGGIIKYETNKPNFNKYSAGVELGTWNVAHGGEGYSGKGYVNMPLFNNTVALRVMGYYEDAPGWVANKFLGQSEVNTLRRYGGRAELAWRPTQDLSIRGTVSLQTRNANGTDSINVNGLIHGTLSNQFTPSSGYNYNGESNTLIRNQIALYALHVDYDLHWAKFQSITSYGLVNEHFQDDVPSFDSTLQFYTGLNSQTTAYEVHNVNKFNQEFRLSSEVGNQLWDHPFEWQVGLFATRENVTFKQNYLGTVYPTGAPLPSIFNKIGFDNLPSFYDEEAIYADGTYHFTPKFDIELGARLATSKEGSTATEGGFLFSLPGSSITFAPVTKSEIIDNFSFAPRYHFTKDIMAYFRMATGYRPGGPDIPVVGVAPGAIPSTFHSDSLMSYEIGAKGEFFNRTLTADVAVFDIDWSNIQIVNVVYVGAQGYGVVGNAGSATSRGVEWNFAWRPITGLTIGFLGAYTDAHLTADAPGLGGKAGDQLAEVPKISGSLNADYVFPAFGDFKGFVGGGINYIGERYGDFSTVPTVDHLKWPSYENYEARFGLKNGKYTIEVYGKNLSDARGITYYSPYGAFGNYGALSIIRPRTIGLRLAADF